MNLTTSIVGVDLAKNKFEVVIADQHYRVQQRKTLTRARFERFIAQQPPSLFVLEACGSAHHWARRLREYGHEARLLPAQYVRAYVTRNKTDHADAAALIEASRCEYIQSVPIKTVEQQQLQLLHRLREQYKRTRNARMNLLRGCLREVGISVPVRIDRGMNAVREALEMADNGLPDGLRPWLSEVLQEMGALKTQMARIERQIEALTRDVPLVQRWLEIPGVGLLGASATYAAVVDMNRFPTARHFPSWLGITPREHSSGERRRLGRISKQGDKYLRTLVVHGARSALNAAHRAQQAGRPLDALRQWALQVEQRCGTNKATVALANKIARILWATAVHDRPFEGNWSTRRDAPNSEINQAA